jgi:hypothetical protein
MGIEVRQLLIRAQVNVTPAAPTRPALSSADLQRLREQLLAECRHWVTAQLQAQRER